MSFKKDRKDNCGISTALSILGDKWTLLIARDIMMGNQNFESIQNNLNISSSVTLDTGDIIRQDNSNAYGVVEAGGNLNVISVVGVEGVFDTVNNLRKEGNNGTIENLSVTPTGVNVIYSTKPTWTSTLDGGTF